MNAPEWGQGQFSIFVRIFAIRVCLAKSKHNGQEKESGAKKVKQNNNKIQNSTLTSLFQSGCQYIVIHAFVKIQGQTRALGTK